MPEHSPTAAEVVRLSCLDREPERLGVHVPVHQQLPRLVVGGYRGDEPVGVEFRSQLRSFFDLLDAHSRAEFVCHLIVCPGSWNPA